MAIGLVNSLELCNSEFDEWKCDSNDTKCVNEEFTRRIWFPSNTTIVMTFIRDFSPKYCFGSVAFGRSHVQFSSVQFLHLRILAPNSSIYSLLFFYLFYIDQAVE